MKVTVEFTLSLDGDITEEKAKKIFLGEYGLGKIGVGVVSKDVDGTYAYFIGFDGWEEK